MATIVMSIKQIKETPTTLNDLLQMISVDDLERIDINRLHSHVLLQMRDRIVWAVGQGCVEPDVLTYYDALRCTKEQYMLAKLVNRRTIFPYLIHEPKIKNEVLNFYGKWVPSQQT